MFGQSLDGSVAPRQRVRRYGEAQSLAALGKGAFVHAKRSSTGRAVTVVVKQGPRGVLGRTRDEMVEVPSMVGDRGSPLMTVSRRDVPAGDDVASAVDIAVDIAAGLLSGQGVRA